MKKQLIGLLCLFFFVSIAALPVSAGSIPHDLLHKDSAQVFFGRVEKATAKTVVISPYKNIKGDFPQESTLSCVKVTYNGKLQTGRVYLCARLDTTRPLSLWEVDTLDPQIAKIPENAPFSDTMQNYLNSGEFEAREIERRERLGLPDPPEDTLLSNNPNPPRPIWLLPAAITGGILLVGGGITIGLMLRRKKKSSATE